MLSALFVELHPFMPMQRSNRSRRYKNSDFGGRLTAELAGKTEIKTEMESIGNFGDKEIPPEQSVAGGENVWRPRRDLNPCYRRERPVSWAELDDGDVLVSRTGFEPATLCLK